MPVNLTLHTKTYPVDAANIGKLHFSKEAGLDDWRLELDESTEDGRSLKHAANMLQLSDIPVAFPTETVYGLGADATRSSAVKGIYAAKQRPSDNPLIVHIASLNQLRSLLQPPTPGCEPQPEGFVTNGDISDPIPLIYEPLITLFWPGPLTIILPNHPKSILAPEVTAGLETFGARMPRNILALALIKLADRPIAAPSANASTKPSPTAAEHVAHDLKGRLETIIDGGPCDIGVESTVVDGLSNPPAILRPGGISLDQIRECLGWENTVAAYKDKSEDGGKPKAPGMKYRHYSPKAAVVLFESGAAPPALSDLRMHLKAPQNRRRPAIGVVRTKTWTYSGAENEIRTQTSIAPCSNGATSESPAADEPSTGFAILLHTLRQPQIPQARIISLNTDFDLWDVELGHHIPDIARGLFSALRELDRKDVDAILVEGINDAEGNIAAAVMNRLRKAAEVKVDG